MKLLSLLLFLSTNAFADTPSVHGMVLFGDQTIYASHLPMFHAPHDYQAVFQVKLQNTKTIAAYEAEKERGQSLFTIAPERMDLTQVISRKKTKFSAALFSGHFEQGGKNLGPVQVEVEEVLLGNKLDPRARAKANEYLVFGKDGSYFAVHLVVGQPNFDAIVQVQQPARPARPCRGLNCPEFGAPISDAELPLTLFSFSSNQPILEERLHGDAITKVLKVIYSEDADLR
jgi:hypothetical protein